jgi:cytochrome c peroxidase
VDLYNRGSIANPYLDPMMVPLNLTRREKADVVAFLEALTGESPNISEPVLPQ